MKANRVLLAGLMAIAGSAFADGVTIDTNPVASTRTRADVKAEVRKALAAGEQFVVGESSYDPTPVAQSTVTRSEVKAELAAAQAAGLIQYGESDHWAGPVASVRSRGDVKAEFVAARASGELIAYGEAYDPTATPNPKPVVASKAWPKFLAQRRAHTVAQ